MREDGKPELEFHATLHEQPTSWLRKLLEQSAADSKTLWFRKVGPDVPLVFLKQHLNLLLE